MNLNAVKKGHKVRFVSFGECATPSLISRLRSLGFQNKIHIEVIKKSYFSSVITVEVNNICLALRKNEAACIKVESCSCLGNQYYKNVCTE